MQEAFAMPPDPDPSSPTAPCARCGEAKVFAIADSQDVQYLCVSCKALLALHFTEVSPG
jgi:formylmethanofuran dehydrogenase subunit E